MIPILYPSWQMELTDNGIGALADTIDCKCTEVLNGEYELEMESPMDGMFVSEIEVGCIIKEKPNYEDPPQPFRIYSVEKSIDGKVKTKAAHISYDTNGIPVLPFTSDTLGDTLDNINENQHVVTQSGFLISANFDAEAEFKITVPTAFKSLLGGGDNTLLGVYGGDLHYNGYDIELLEHRGYNLGICFRTSKNVIDFNQETNSDQMYSAIFGYWKGSDDDDFVCGDILVLESQLPIEKTMILDVSSSFQSEPTVDEVNEAVNTYLQNNNIAIPKFNMSITYAEDDEITKVNLGDTVGVLIHDYRINATARCNKVVFDCLLERNESIELGDVDTGIAGEIADLSNNL